MKDLLTSAKKHLVGGVNSPVRSFNYVGGNPVLMEKGKGSKVYDQGGNAYIDYVLSFGALMLGHAHPRVIKQTQRIVKKGMGFGTTTRVEVELAALIKKSTPGIEKIRFVNSGTEAVMSALRLARGYTSRDKIIKFANSYHGHADYLLVKSGSGLASLSIPVSKGVPADFIKHTIVLNYGDKKDIDRIFKKHGRDIAAVVVEPAGGNYGVIPPDKDFLKRLRSITKKYGVLLIFDEIITGFRFSYGTLGDKLGIKPDLVCLGKIIGGGLPIGAYGGREEIMDHLAPLGEVYQASTFAGNPVVMQAGIETLKAISSLKGKYRLLVELTEDLSQTIQKEAKKQGIELEVSHYGPMFSLKFREKAQFQRFYRILLSRGVYLAPSEYETNFISFAHTTKDIEKTKIVIRRAFKNLQEERKA
ncbi:glutamate-1-semialdehyde 2,1-aminomutase [Candidatus Omnitrophota bacterium]